MLKVDLRRQFLQKRKELTASDKDALDVKISDSFFLFLPQSVFTVHIYLPIKCKYEIDTWPIIRKLWAMNINTTVPVIDQETLSIKCFLLTPETASIENEWQISEPVNAPLIEHCVIDLVVLPLVAFDLRGYRVGYGKGYYDKLLASFQHQPIKVGLSYFDPVPEISDLHNFDLPMDYCITPGRLFKF